MAVRKIRIWPDAALKEGGRPVPTVNAQTQALITDMFDTMYESNGIGLAAPQIGVAQRVIVIDLDPRNEAPANPEWAEELATCGFAKPTAFVNPEIIASEGSITWEEGCLSVPGYTDDVKRKARVVVQALDGQGHPFTTEAAGLFAVALQHEIDHLDGRVFVEYLSKIKRDVVKRKMLRLKEQQAVDDAEQSAPPTHRLG